MIIRSQDKKMLASYETGIWQAMNCKIYWLSLNNGDYWLDFGVFSTEEKAIKTLNRIEIAYSEPIYQNTFTDTEVHIFKNKVFQIPSEEEIDEPTVQTIIDDLNAM